jgi:hypothetical protein
MDGSYFDGIIGRWGLIGGSRSLGCDFDGTSCPGPSLSASQPP